MLSGCRSFKLSKSWQCVEMVTTLAGFIEIMPSHGLPESPMCWCPKAHLLLSWCISWVSCANRSWHMSCCSLHGEFRGCCDSGPSASSRNLHVSALNKHSRKCMGSIGRRDTSVYGIDRVSGATETHCSWCLGRLQNVLIHLIGTCLDASPGQTSG